MFAAPFRTASKCRSASRRAFAVSQISLKVIVFMPPPRMSNSISIFESRGSSEPREAGGTPERSAFDRPRSEADACRPCRSVLMASASDSACASDGAALSLSFEVVIEAGMAGSGSLLFSVSKAGSSVFCAICSDGSAEPVDLAFGVKTRRERIAPATMNTTTVTMYRRARGVIRCWFLH